MMELSKPHPSMFAQEYLSAGEEFEKTGDRELAKANYEEWARLHIAMSGTVTGENSAPTMLASTVYQQVRQAGADALPAAEMS
ncbi:hypothetical protein ACFY6U_51645 [Streptomyces sp. NPDC013157]|uniref:hypothetical protein n=1 Tax=Streptomyces sp. NPDC013157 TaxID=3364861 RepID=UPI0036A985B9